MCFPVLIAALSWAQAPETLPRFEQLPNGLRVCVVEDHALPLVSVQLWYRAGSADDPPQRVGLCHVTRTVLEHREDAALRARAAGVRFESRTLEDACCYVSVLPAELLDYALAIEAQRMRPLKVEPDALQAALAAAARDYGLTPDDPQQQTDRTLRAAMFPNHPYGQPPGFVAAPLRDLTPQAVERFAAQWFTPRNATLFIIGDVSALQVMEAVRTRFAAPAAGDDPPRREPLPSLPEERLELAAPVRTPPAKGGASGTRVLDVAWLTPRLGHFENAALDVLMHRLCNPVDGPLHRRLAELGCTPRWRRETWRDSGMLVLSVDCDPSPRGQRSTDPSPKREHPSPQPEHPSPKRERGQIPGADRGALAGASGSDQNRAPDSTGSLQNATGSLQNATGSLQNATGSLQNATGSLQNATGTLQNATGSLLPMPSGTSTGGQAARGTPSIDAAALKAVFDELTRAGQTLPTEIEHNRARALAAADARHRRAAFGERARLLAEHEIVAGDLLLADFELPQISAVSVLDVQQAALTLLHSRTVVLHHVAPDAATQPTQAASQPAVPAPPELAPVLPAVPPQPLDPDAALELLAAHAGDAPPIRTPADPPRVESEPVRGRIRATICTRPGVPTAIVRTLVRWPSPGDRGPFGLLLRAGTLDLSGEQIADYCAYHGIDLHDVQIPDYRGLAARATSDRVPQMIELQAELIRRPNLAVMESLVHARHRQVRETLNAAGGLPERLPDDESQAAKQADQRAEQAVLGAWRADLATLQISPEIHVVIVADMQRDDALAALRSAWPTDGLETPPADEHLRAAEERWHKEAAWRRPDVFVLGKSEFDSTAIMCRLARRRAGTPDLDIARDAGLWLLAQAPGVSAALDGEREWRWPFERYVPVGDLHAVPAVDENGTPGQAEVQRLLEPLARLRAGATPAAQLEQALRLARARRLTSLDSSEAIADILQTGLTQPWDVQPELPPERCAELLKNLFGAGPPQIRAFKVNAETIELLRRYGTVESYP